jgi:hypothetical protein
MAMREEEDVLGEVIAHELEVVNSDVGVRNEAHNNILINKS